MKKKTKSTWGDPVKEPGRRSYARRRMVRELDASARLKCFERDNYKCVFCPHRRMGTKRMPIEGRSVQWAHIFSRRHPALRWEADNCLSLCAGCHLWWHHCPVLAVDKFRSLYPERYERIVKIYQANPKVNVKAKWEELEGK